MPLSCLPFYGRPRALEVCPWSPWCPQSLSCLPFYGRCRALEVCPWSPRCPRPLGHLEVGGGRGVIVVVVGGGTLLALATDKRRAHEEVQPGAVVPQPRAVALRAPFSPTYLLTSDAYDARMMTPVA